MNVEAWPFLISRNKTLDYRVIVAPDFVSRDGFSELISLTNGDVTERHVSVWRQMRNTNGQTLTLVFRVEYAQIEGNYVRDGFGRLIVWVFGLILEGSRNEVSVTNDVFDTVDQIVYQSFWKFWDRSEHMSVVRSDAVHLGFDKESQKLIFLSCSGSRTTSKLSASNSSLGFTIVKILSALKKNLAAFFRLR